MRAPTGRWETLSHGVLGTAVALLTVAGVVVGCSTAPSDAPDSSSSSSSDSAAPAPAGDAPTLTGAPNPATVPQPLWDAGTSRGGDPLANFRDTPYNNDGAEAPTIEASPNIDGRRAIKFTMPGGGKRTELEPKVPILQEGDEFYYGFAHYLPPEFPVQTQDWQVIAQWKNSGEGSPPIEVKIGQGQYFLDGGAGGDDPGSTYFSMPIGPARAGAQTDLVVHIKFSSDSAKSVVDVWMNGQKRISNFRPPGGTRYSSDDSYLKTGIYRDTSINEPADLFLNDARIAKSYDSAAALAGPPSSG